MACRGTWSAAAAAVDRPSTLPSPGRPQAPTSLRTFAEHTYCVYAAQWNPQQADVFLSASGDCTVKVGVCVCVCGKCV